MRASVIPFHLENMFWHVEEQFWLFRIISVNILTCWNQSQFTMTNCCLQICQYDFFFWVIPVLLRYEVCFPSMFFMPPVGFYASWLFGWLVQCRLCFGFPAALIYLLVKPATQSGSPKSRSGLLKNCLFTKFVHCQFDFLNTFCNLLLSSLENNTTWIHGAVCAAKRQMTVCLKKTRYINLLF